MSDEPAKTENPGDAGQDRGTLTIPTARDFDAKTTIEGEFPIGVTIQTLRSMDEIADEISARIAPILPKPVTSGQKALVVVADDTLIDALSEFRALRALVAGPDGKPEGRFESMGSDMVNTGLSAVAGIVGWLGVTREYKSTDPGLTTAVLLATLAGRLLEKGAELRTAENLKTEGKLHAIIGALLARIESQRTLVAKEPENNNAVQRCATLEAALASLTTGEFVDKRVGVLNAASGLDWLIEAYAPVFLLDARLIQAGGYTHVARSLFTLIGFGGQPRFAGGSVTTFSLSRLDSGTSTILLSDTLYSMTGEGRPDAVNGLFRRKNF